MAYKRIIRFVLFFVAISKVASECGFANSNFVRLRVGNHPIIFQYKTDGAPIAHYPRVDHNFDCVLDSFCDERIHLACQTPHPHSGAILEFHEKIGPDWRVTNVTVEKSMYVLHSPTSPSGIRVHGDTKGIYTANPESYVVCSNELSSVILDTTKSFRPTEETYLIGYRLNDFDLLKVYEYAELFDSKWKVTHVRIPAIINERLIFGYEDYVIGLLYRNKKLNFNELYSKEYQMSAFQRHFNNRELTQKYFSGNNMLVTGQLISQLDMFYYYEQASTRYYDVTVPIWESVYSGNWRYIGEMIRNLASESGRDLHVFTASLMGFHINKSANWTLGNTNSSPDTVAIPYLLVKAAIDVENRARGMVFHTYNDPYMDLEVAEAQLGDYCSRPLACKVMHPQFAHVLRGYTFCCMPEDSYVLNEMLMLKWI